MTLDLARWIEEKGGKVRAHRFMPLPGTPLWEKSLRPYPAMLRRSWAAWHREAV